MSGQLGTILGFSHRLAPTSFCTRWAGAVLAVKFILLMVVAPGCVSLRRNPVSEDVVASRQMSLQAMEAMEQGRWEDAERLFAKAIKVYPADERAHRSYAEILWRRGDWGEAINHMQRSVQLSGGDPQVLVQLGEMYLARGYSRKAWEQAEQAIEAHQQFAHAWALRGDVLRHQGELSAAMVSYHRALSLQEHYPKVQLALAEIYRQQGRARRALATLGALADHYDPGSVPQEVLYLQGLALKALKRYEDAVEVLLAAAERDAPHADLLYQLAEAQWLAGDGPKARLATRAALNLQPQHEASRRLRDRIRQEQGKLSAGRL